MTMDHQKIRDHIHTASTTNVQTLFRSKVIDQNFDRAVRLTITMDRIDRNTFNLMDRSTIEIEIAYHHQDLLIWIVSQYWVTENQQLIYRLVERIHGDRMVVRTAVPLTVNTRRIIGDWRMRSNGTMVIISTISNWVDRNMVRICRVKIRFGIIRVVDTMCRIDIRTETKWTTMDWQHCGRDGQGKMVREIFGCSIFWKKKILVS